MPYSFATFSIRVLIFLIKCPSLCRLWTARCLRCITVNFSFCLFIDAAQHFAITTISKAKDIPKLMEWVAFMVCRPAKFFSFSLNYWSITLFCCITIQLISVFVFLEHWQGFQYFSAVHNFNSVGPLFYSSRFATKSFRYNLSEHWL